VLTTILTQENKPEDRHAVSITGFSSLSTNIRLVLFPSVSTRLSLTYASANMRCNYGKDENRDDRSLEIDYCFGCDHISMSNSQFDSVASVILGHFSFAVSIHARARVATWQSIFLEGSHVSIHARASCDCETAEIVVTCLNPRARELRPHYFFLLVAADTRTIIGNNNIAMISHISLITSLFSCIQQAPP
jgi:hypothetical protein